MKLVFHVKVEGRCPPLAGDTQGQNAVNEWAENLRKIISKKPENKIAEKVFVRIDFFRKKPSVAKADVDNLSVTVLNTLTKVGILKDDSFIVKLDAQKLEADIDYTEVWVFSFS